MGPRPFEPTENDRSRFHGRNREVAEIVSLVLSHPLVVVYARSGAGKTSLFNAAVTPALEQKGFTVLPLARVRNAVPDDLRSSIRNLYSFCALLSLEPKADPHVLAKTSLSAALSGAPDAPEREAPRAIVFDQLEEIFTFEKVFELYPTHWQDQQEGFFREITALLADDPLLRVVFVIRKEFLAELNRFARLLPEDLQTQFRLEPLDAAAALQAVKRPLEGTPRHFADGVAENLVEKLRTEPIEVAPKKTVDYLGRFVEPVQLQLVCSRLWRELPASTREITEQHVQAFGDVDRVLGQFYDDTVQAVASPPRLSERALRRRIEKDFITSIGTRATVYRSQWESLGNAIEKLEDRRLVRGELRAGTQWYELTHDRLIDPIRKSNARYFATRTGRQLITLLTLLPVAVVAAVLYFALRPSHTETVAGASAAALSAAQQQLTLSQKLVAVSATRASGFGGPGHQEIRAVAPVSGALHGLAVGVDRGRAVIWSVRSDWRRESGTFGRGWFTAIGQLGRTVVVAGRAGPDDPTSRAQDATIWAFVHGKWRQVCGKTSGCGEGGGGSTFGQTIWGLTTARLTGGAREAVAVGYDTSRDPDGSVHLDGAVWRSGDGIRWRRVVLARSFAGPGDQELRAVVDADGILVAAGRRRKDAAVWRSSDGGAHWRAVASSAFHAAHAALDILGLANHGSRIVAVGWQATEKGNRAEAAVWLSTDYGRTWKRQRSRVFQTRGGAGAGFAQRGQQMTDVAAAPFGFVAVGLDHPSGPAAGSVAAMWTSLDGTQWTPVSNPSLAGAGSREMNASALFDGLVVAAGDRPSLAAPNDTGEQDAAIWEETPVTQTG